MHLPRRLDYPPVGADAILAGAAHRFPARTALRDPDGAVSYAELHDLALRVAGGLRERGVEPGDAVALHLANSPMVRHRLLRRAVRGGRGRADQPGPAGAGRP